MTDFNFLRIKWPKLAAIAADASRLVEVSPASAISTMQNFCEWAADIALDFFDINTQNGITQQEKLETMKATGRVPQDVLARFNDIMMAGNRRLYRVNEDVEEARRCIEDVYEIGRWLNKEADRSGWPPRTESYRPAVSSMGEGNGFSSGRAGQFFYNYRSLILGGSAVLIIVVLVIWGVTHLIGSVATGGKKTSPPVITPTPTISVAPSLTPVMTPTAPPETVTFLDTLTPTNTHKESFFLKKWAFSSGDKNFTIGDKKYENGIGMFIPKKSITKTQGTWSMKFKLDGQYDKLRFDLGVDAGLQYGEGYGKFRLMLYKDSVKEENLLYDSKLREYNFTDLGQEVSVKDCETLIIQLTEQKGSKGTINVVLGNIRLVQGGEPTGSAEPGNTDGTGASASPSTGSSASASASPSPTPTGTAKASASPKTTVDSNGGDGEQQQPPE